MKRAKYSIPILLAIVLGAASCTETGGHKARLEQLESGLGKLEQEVGVLQARVDEAAEHMSGTFSSFEKAAAGCSANAHSFVRKHQGADCDTFEWELAASSRRCVESCDETARYNEAVAAGQAKCEELCAERECPRGVFTPPADCEALRCFPNFPGCPQNCTTFNSCYLIQTRSAWNCRCLEL